MPLLFKPHTATILSVSDALGGVGEVVGDSRGSGGTVDGHLCSLSPAQTFEQFGIDTNSGGKWLQDINAAELKPGDHITVDGQKYAILTRRVVYNAVGSVGYEAYAVERVK